MTAPTQTDTDQLRAFLDALPRHTRTALHRTEAVVGMVHAAIRDHGWTAKQLAAECGRDTGDVANPGAVVTHRLRHAAGNPPPRPTAAGFNARAFCTPECRTRAGQIEHPETGLPIGWCPCRTAPPTTEALT